MAICRVITATEGWNVGDHVNPEGEDLNDLLDRGIVELVEDEEKPKKEKAPKK